MQQKRVSIVIKGIVQGVGFRPFVHRVARRHDIAGWILNYPGGVKIEAEGEDGSVDSFIEELTTQPPPMATIMEVEIEALKPKGEAEFIIRESLQEITPYILVSPDIALCADCARELDDSLDRRFQYPFTNCTNCGPRYTIIQEMPYDRPNTTMSKFPMCENCQSEYDDIDNRRYHAQPNACPKCGPSLSFLGQGQPLTDLLALEAAKEALRRGEIVAVKGLGGFHLACDATDERAVLRLRERKRREEKPLAIMCRDMEAVEELCLLSAKEREILTSPQSPIMLLRKKSGPIAVAEAVAPGNRYLGIMLPYTPLHKMLLQDFLALVMTSGNLSDEPLAIQNEEAQKRLTGIADHFLAHNRDIVTGCDDSVTRFFGGKEVLIRRSRGYAPFPIPINFELPDTLACGAELKTTFCLARGNMVFLSQHIGDLENWETYSYYTTILSRLKRLLRIEPQVVAYDLHPEYLSTKYAQSLEDVKLVGVQHHHAHVISCMVDNDLAGRAVGIACDGLGYGSDGNFWGCEVLVVDPAEKAFERRAHLRYLPMPGATKAIKEPWRMTAALLYDSFGEDFLAEAERVSVPCYDREKWQALKQVIDRKVNAPLASSLGRLFDGVSALLGVRNVNTYEGQAACELEMLANESTTERYDFSLGEEDGLIVINPDPTIREIMWEMCQDIPRPIIARKFHNTVSAFLVEATERIAKSEGLKNVVLSGGVFQNMILLESVLDGLKERGLKPYFHHRVPTNDGGLCLGQAIIANAR